MVEFLAHVLAGLLVVNYRIGSLETAIKVVPEPAKVNYRIGSLESINLRSQMTITRMLSQLESICLATLRL